MFGTDFDKMFRFPPPKLIEEKSVNFGDWKLKHPDSFKFLKICKNDEFQNQSDFSQIRTEKHNNAMKKLSIMAQKLNKIEDKVEEDLKLQEENEDRQVDLMKDGTDKQLAEMQNAWKTEVLRLGFTHKSEGVSIDKIWENW